MFRRSKIPRAFLTAILSDVAQEFSSTLQNTAGVGIRSGKTYRLYLSDWLKN
ncbi:hypothetical protein [Geoglobus sp.]